MIRLLVSQATRMGWNRITRLKEDFVSWRDKSFIMLNVAKTKDTTIDFRESSSAAKAIVWSDVIIKGEEIELVEHDK